MGRREASGWRRISIGVAVATVGLFATAGCLGPTGPRNVITISVDTLIPEEVPGFGGDGTGRPTLERLAAGAHRFTRAHSVASWTLPAHASLLTGLYPDRHGATDPRTHLPDDLPTLAHRLRDAGWETVAFTGQRYLDRRFGFAAGFDLYDDDWSAPGGRRPLALPRRGQPDEQGSEPVFDRGIAYLRARPQDAPPFFLFLHTYAVHDYYRVHPWAAPASGEKLLDTDAYLACLTGDRRCTSDDWRTLRSLYTGEVKHFDRGLAELLAALDASGERDRTWIILCSDHGEGFDFERTRIHHAGRLHADQLRIPLLVAGPDASAGESRTPISLVDIAPTVLDLLGVPVPAGLDGRSFAPRIRGKETRGLRRPMFAIEHHFTWQGGRRTNSATVLDQPGQIAVIGGRGWLILEGDRPEVYDVLDDPAQRTNLAGTGRAHREPGLRALADTRLSVRMERHVHALDPDLHEQLRAIGYVE